MQQGNDLDNFEAHADETIEKYEQAIQSLKIAKIQYRALRFKSGDVAKHLKFGNCLITAVYNRSMHGVNMNVPWPSDKPHVQFIYHIIYTNSASTLTRRNGADEAYVTEEELIPITQMSETLYK